MGAGLVAVAAGAVTFAFADSGSERIVVWQLATDWKEPRGPHDKTHLVSAASRNAATHRFARTEEHALTMNLHAGSWAPAIAVSVEGAAFETMWAQSSRTWTNAWAGQDVEILDVRWDTTDASGVNERFDQLRVGEPVSPSVPATTMTRPPKVRPTTTLANGFGDGTTSPVGVVTAVAAMASLSLARRRLAVAEAQAATIELAPHPSPR